jgi:hypothetical protein
MYQKEALQHFDMIKGVLVRIIPLLTTMDGEMLQ